MDKLTRAFADFYRPRIADGVSRAHADAGGDTEQLIESVVSCLAKRLQGLVARVFVVDFHERRAEWGLPIDENSTTAIKRYMEDFGSATVERWFNTYPVLAELVDVVVDSSVAHVLEIEARWRADRPSLLARGFVAAGADLSSIEQMASDPHQHGRMVAALHFTDGSRLIYKPRSLGPEEFTRACLGRISESAGIDLSVCAPESFDRGEYGWQPEVVRRPADSEVEIRDYYYRFGAVCGFLNAVGAVDLHHENVLAVGDHPVVLDLETVLHSPPSIPGEDLSTAIVKRLKRSLANTLLLPHRLATGPYSVLISGIGIGHEQQSSRTSFVVTNGDTDAVDIARRTFPFTHGDNVLIGPDGEPTDVLDYRAEFVDGLRRGTEAVSDHAEELIAMLDARPVTVRQIFRSTAVYGKVLEAATHPDNLQRREDFERVISMLTPPPAYDRSITQTFISEVEKQALARADIPYFVADSDEIRNRAEGLVSLPATDRSPRDRAAYGLRRTGAESLLFEELLVEEGFAELRSSRREHSPEYQPSMDGAWSEPLLSADGVDAAAVLQRLFDVSVSVEGVDGVERGWVCGAFGPSIGTFDPGTRVSLHDAGGMVLPFERAAMRGDERALDTAREARRGLQSLSRQYRARLDEVPLSVASGKLSVEYVLGHGDRRLRISDWDGIGLDDADMCPPDDAVIGLPGAGLLLAGFPDTPRATLESIATRLPDGAGRRWEVAHGDIGVLWARHRVATALGDQREVDRVASRFDSELAAAPEGLDAAWCGGHAGLCMVAAELSQEEALVRRQAERATAVPSDNSPIDLSVCHGAAGVVQSLIHLANCRRESWPVDLAADYWQRVAKYARESSYVTGDPARQGLLGYFLGWAGIADTALMLAAALDGETVWVPVSFTSSHEQRDGGAA